MAKPLVPLHDLFEKKARAGDCAYAISCVLIDLADAQEATAKAIQNLGNGDAATNFEAIEGLAMNVEKVAEAIEPLDFSNS